MSMLPEKLNGNGGGGFSSAVASYHSYSNTNSDYVVALLLTFEDDFEFTVVAEVGSEEVSFEVDSVSFVTGCCSVI